MVASSTASKKNPFLAPSTCPIDLFGPLANRTVLKRLHAAIRFCWLVSYRPLARLRRDAAQASILQSLVSPRLIAGVTSTGQSHTYWPEAHRAHTVHTDISCAARRPSSSSAHGCSNKFVGTRNTRCGRVLTALKAAATAATRTRHTRAALSERRETAEHSMQAAATPPASDPASTKQRSAARDERTSIGNLSDFYA